MVSYAFLSLNFLIFPWHLLAIIYLFLTFSFHCPNYLCCLSVLLQRPSNIFFYAFYHLFHNSFFFKFLSFNVLAPVRIYSNAFTLWAFL